MDSPTFNGYRPHLSHFKKPREPNKAPNSPSVSSSGSSAQFLYSDAGMTQLDFISVSPHTSCLTTDPTRLGGLKLLDQALGPQLWKEEESALG